MTTSFNNSIFYELTNGDSQHFDNCDRSAASFTSSAVIFPPGIFSVITKACLDYHDVFSAVRVTFPLHPDLYSQLVFSL